MNDTTTPKPTMRQLAAAALKHYSTWFVAAVSAIGAYWMAMPPADQQSLLALLPEPWMAPLISAAVFFLLKIIPQQPKGPTPPATPDDKP